MEFWNGTTLSVQIFHHSISPVFRAINIILEHIMLFVCDIGNSKIKAGFFKDEKLSGIKIFEDVDEVLEFVSRRKVHAAAVSSVVPGKLTHFKKEFKSRFDFNPVVINGKSEFNLKIGYDTPGTLGIDRICSAEGAFHLYKLNSNYHKNIYILSVDFGTATTINIIKYNGIFAGGLILPGIKLMFKSLNNDTAQLPEVKPAAYIHLIGSSTKSSIASGVINATVGAINQVITHLKQHNKKEIIIYTTGGNAKFVVPYLNFNYAYEQGLVLYGIKAVYDNTIKKKKFSA